MGRWGYRLFEADTDIDIVCELENALVRSEGAESFRLSHMVHQTDMLAPPGARDYFQTEEYRLELDDFIVSVRNQLDSDLGEKLFDKYCAGAKEFQDQYRLILVGALMMRAGAKIKEEHFQHLRDLVPKIDCRPGFALPTNDLRVRSPGKARFLAALDNYQPGTPRDYEEPSWFYCGKVRADLGKTPKKCGRCERAWYCGIDCQKAHWKFHKPLCKPMSEVTFLNV
ncbi:MYND finger domain-containing protein [Colletotrichum tofieldiae]|nr:MYND finger domain-containing protein [Colletotrichum tofieldiae]GKT72781.1 MYND finger domain-containing protein [Colletotrichum tofieldiae]GKT89376.1 MYND finger domain-containing protein [Colletotrichum tofieldiae]